MLVVIDPGHGGRQPGAVGPTGLREDDVCLAVALRFRELIRLTAHTQGWDIRFTRTTDVDVSLGDRIAPASAACFISIHCNAHSNRRAHGTETIVQIGDLPRSGVLASILQRHLIAQLRLRNRGVKTMNLQVLRQSLVPAVLIELAFISNPIEETLLRNINFQEQAAQALVAGVTEFLSMKS